MEQFLFGTAYEAQNQDDIVLTPVEVAQDIIDHFKPAGKCLDPCKGPGAFYDRLPLDSDWCELKDGRDFFDYNLQVDWIVSNPPYSIFAKFLDHSFKVAENIVYLIPINKPFNSFAILQRIKEWGGIKEIYVVAPGSKLNFPIGFCIGAVHFKRGYKGEIKISFKPEQETAAA